MKHMEYDFDKKKKKIKFIYAHCLWLSQSLCVRLKITPMDTPTGIGTREASTAGFDALIVKCEQLGHTNRRVI